jgi:hypothetical protein
MSPSGMDRPRQDTKVPRGFDRCSYLYTAQCPLDSDARIAPSGLFEKRQQNVAVIENQG